MILPQARGLTAERLRKLLAYDPVTGVFRWRERRQGVRKNLIAGCVHEGYVIVKIDDVDHRASHLAWMYVHGEYPDRSLDHRDLDRANNCIANLRKATQAQNQANRRPRRGSALGVKGVERLPSGRYRAGIRVNYRQLYLGCFDTSEDASRAYEAAARTYFGEFARAA